MVVQCLRQTTSKLVTGNRPALRQFVLGCSLVLGMLVTAYIFFVLVSLTLCQLENQDLLNQQRTGLTQLP